MKIFVYISEWRNELWSWSRFGVSIFWLLFFFCFFFCFFLAHKEQKGGFGTPAGGGAGGFNFGGENAPF
jgi:hypothetical protein